MRNSALLTLAATLLMGAACVPDKDKDPEWLKPPERYQPQTADLTFNKVNLEQFNLMSDAERENFVKGLIESKGSFRGQAVSKTGAGLGNMPDSKYGEWELNAIAEEVLFEISIDYNLFTTKEIGNAIAPNRYVEFTGTLIDLDFQEESKPRKLKVRVQTDTLAPIKD